MGVVGGPAGNGAVDVGEALIGVATAESELVEVDAPGAWLTPLFEVVAVGEAQLVRTSMPVITTAETFHGIRCPRAWANRWSTRPSSVMLTFSCPLIRSL
ncbi:MAG TPA: hypothetical protein VIJ41_05185 [Candidatus Nanopelagicales bacterium]